MKLLSTWAFHHKWLARLSIILLWVLLHLISSLLSILIEIPGAITDVGSITVSIIILFLFFETSFSRKSLHYTKRKIYDGCLALSTFLLLVFLQQKSENVGSSIAFASVQSNVHPENKNISSGKIITSKKFTLLKKWKEIRQYVKLIRKEMRDKGSGKKTALIILTIIVGIFALLLIAALSCGISCNGGGEGLAIAVGLIGAGAVIFLIYKVIYRINHGPKKIPPETQMDKT